MRFLRTIITLSLALPLVAAQNFVPTGANGQFPACAASCAVLEQTQSTCLTQTGQQTTGLAAENCFCQSAALQGLYSTPDALCVAECPSSTDRAGLRTWFMSFCAQVGQGVDPNAQTTSATPTATATDSTGTSTPTAIDAGSSSGSNSTTQSASNGNESWISGHWQWIVMIIALAIGLGLLAALLIFLKKRHRRKVNERRAQMGGFPTEREKAAGARAATPDLWGPHQHMHASKGWEYQEGAGPGVMAAGAVPGSRSEKADRAGRTERKRSRRRSLKPGSRTRDSMTEITDVQRPPASRGQSSKGKRVDADAIEVQRNPSQSRSRSRKPPRGAKYDFDRDVENQKEADLELSPAVFKRTVRKMVNWQDDDFVPSIKATHHALEKPELGPILVTGQRRALIGWTHQRNNASGYNDRQSQIWGWVTASNSFHVYISEDNRGEVRGMRYDTGHTNFSRIRMFHPYWCQGGIPRDLYGRDKERVRALYRQLIESAIDDATNNDTDEDQSDGDDADDADNGSADQARDQRREARRQRAWERQQSKRQAEAYKHQTGEGNRVSREERIRLEVENRKRQQREADEAYNNRNQNRISKKKQYTNRRRRNQAGPSTTRANLTRKRNTSTDRHRQSSSPIATPSSSSSSPRPRPVLKTHQTIEVNSDDDDYDFSENEAPGPSGSAPQSSGFDFEINESDHEDLAHENVSGNGAVNTSGNDAPLDAEDQRLFENLHNFTLNQDARPNTNDDGGLFIPESPPKTPERDLDAFTDGGRSPVPVEDMEDVMNEVEDAPAANSASNSEENNAVKVEQDVKPDRTTLDHAFNIDIDPFNDTEDLDFNLLDEDEDIYILREQPARAREEGHGEDIFGKWLRRMKPIRGEGTEDDPMEFD
ncbi:uncharacterized protein AB675_612 [Cyphellophora attinorum]|uniref:WSC domain-containing protein n=1 Tax=Cyphellophora attinorum TaxID=1664694 RepID=A0A0N1P200_9EURO|nr:uncharacterized protein AB675_612 [Phialophora attinorum]KPI46044.1 hypothetical protein AB675_612 [Phialophora attinorum]